MDLKLLIKSLIRVIKYPEILERYESEIVNIETENVELENELEKQKVRFSDYKVKTQIEQNEKIVKYDSLDEKLKIIASKIPLEIENLTSKEVYEKYSSFDEEGWEIYSACEEIIVMDFYREYAVEDNLGWFEMADGHELRYYRELYKFGNTNYKWVSDLETAGNAETIDIKESKINYKSKEYEKYEKELYSKALVKIKERVLKSKEDTILRFIEKTISKNEIEEPSRNYNNSKNYEEDEELDI